MRLSQVASVLALGMKPHVRTKMEQNEEKLAENEPLEVGDIGLDDAAADMSVSDTKAVLIGGSEASDMNQWSTSVVVVPSGPPMRCLRRDMVTDLVFEVWVVVSQGHASTTTLTRSLFDISSKSPMVAMVAAEASYVM